MSDITESLSKKVGPMPLGAWMLAIGGGLGIAVYMRRHAAAAPAAPAGTDTSTWNQGGNTATDPGAGNLGAGGTTITGPTRPTTNDEWLTLAVDNLTAGGKASGSIVNFALSTWLSGASINEQQRAIVDMAIRALGNPPIPPPPSPNAPPPKPTVPPRTVPPMPGQHPHPVPIPLGAYYGHTRLPGDTLPRIVLLYSAKVPGLTIENLWNANKVGIVRLDGTKGVLTSYEHPGVGAHLVIPRTPKLHR